MQKKAVAFARPASEGYADRLAGWAMVQAGLALLPGAKARPSAGLTMPT
jgi:hypothetical protein